tara:strand:- start:2749 stop:4887 length:2139 start_codon:yes stop_codon:yes gene_type:complete
MTDEIKNVEDKVLKTQIESYKEHNDGYLDPSGEYPKNRYINKISTNISATGGEINELYYGGGDKGLDLKLKKLKSSEYPHCKVEQTPTGHVTEIDDTPGRERMLFKHCTGAGVEMRPDGSVIVTSRDNMITICGGDQKVIIEGDGQITYNGNLTLNVTGDYNVKVGGDYNVTVAGDHSEHIRGSQGSRVEKVREHTTVESFTNYIMGVRTETNFSDYNIFTKGEQLNATEGNSNLFTNEKLYLTGKKEGIFSSDDMNIAANTLSVFGASGTIGGDGIIMYNYNMYTGNSIVATDTVTTGTLYSQTANVEDHIETPVVVGSLAGTASKANSSPVGPGGSVGSPGASHVTVDTSATANPTSGILSDYLNKTEKGYKTTIVDNGDFLKNQIDKTQDYGGLSSYPLDTDAVRSKLRSMGNLKNEQFVGRVVSEGILDPSFTNAFPGNIGRIVSVDNITNRGFTPLGNSSHGLSKKFKNENTIENIQTNVLPNPYYNPENQSKITPYVKLAPGITLAKYLGGYGDPNTFTHLTNRNDRLSLAKQYYLQAQAMLSIDQNEGFFKHKRLIVAEGYYKPRPEEDNEKGDNLNFLKNTGEAVVYELLDNEGNMAYEATFDLAVYWKETLQFDKLILDYDTYSGKLNVQVILIMPKINDPWVVTYRNQIETRYNNFVQSTGEFIECIPSPIHDLADTNLGQSYSGEIGLNNAPHTTNTTGPI